MRDIIWYLSLSNLLHLVWSSLGPSTLLQMALSCSFSWLSSIPSCICATSFFFFFLKDFLIYLFIYLFIFGCVGSSVRARAFFQLRQAGATLHRGAGTALHRGARAFLYRGPSRRPYVPLLKQDFLRPLDFSERSGRRFLLETLPLLQAAALLWAPPLHQLTFILTSCPAHSLGPTTDLIEEATCRPLPLPTPRSPFPSTLPWTNFSELWDTWGPLRVASLYYNPGQ